MPPVPMPPGMVMIPQGQGVLGPRPPMPPLVRAPFMPGMPLPPVMQPPQPPVIAAPVKPPVLQPRPPPPDTTDDEPPMKRSRTEDQLMSENEFLAQNKGPVTFQVRRTMIVEADDRGSSLLQTFVFQLCLCVNCVINI